MSHMKKEFIHRVENQKGNEFMREAMFALYTIPPFLVKGYHRNELNEIDDRKSWFPPTQ